MHSIAASLLLDKKEVHFFNDVGYHHPPFTHCPTGESLKRRLGCHCRREVNVDWMDWSCESPVLFSKHVPACSWEKGDGERREERWERGDKGLDLLTGSIFLLIFLSRFAEVLQAQRPALARGVFRGGATHPRGDGAPRRG